MATYHAIAAVGQAVLGLLEGACPRPEFAGAQFALYQASDLLKPPPPMRLGVSLYLYRVAVNGAQRNRAPRLAPDGRRYRPSLPLDLYYLLTPWAETAVVQQRLLGWALRALEDSPILPAGLLNRAGPEAETFRPTDAVELVCEPLSLQDLSYVWDVFEPNGQLSVGYVARMVLLDSPLELTDGPPVQARGFDYGKVTAR